ncbi:hypothetical protein Mgra_00008365 [Meloidogyne graminicola]|uniref:Uncharacterized protein n=1 Tax=Meloidogyne graminicola TaxID=189291 RepID=A0A8S9ZG07_9BILA|nr:hypothetical protein Mgra_00008365 [Meloidogyne graminicola]
MSSSNQLGGAGNYGMFKDNPMNYIPQGGHGHNTQRQITPVQPMLGQYMPGQYMPGQYIPGQYNLGQYNLGQYNLGQYNLGQYMPGQSFQTHPPFTPTGSMPFPHSSPVLPPTGYPFHQPMGHSNSLPSAFIDKPVDQLTFDEIPHIPSSPQVYEGGNNHWYS